MYRDRRVVKGISLQTKSGHIAHALTKHPLATADIFLFNVPKSVDTSTEINYEMLESIKDGKLFSSKYDSQRIKVNTPNIVMVFRVFKRLSVSQKFLTWKVVSLI